MEVSYKALLPRQSILPNELVIEIYINELNELNCIQKKYMVKYAGRIIFDNMGKLKTWNNSSGHYKPNYMDAHIIGLDMNKFHKFIKFSWAKKVI